MGEHIGLLLVYELPDTVKQQRTEAQAYAAVWDLSLIHIYKRKTWTFDDRFGRGETGK